MLNLKRFVLFAINDKKAERHVEQTMIKAGIGFKKVKGCYKGTLEDSYVAVVDEDNKLALVEAIAREFNQECVLLVNENRKAFLKYFREYSPLEYVGDFRAITAEQAVGLDAWTLDEKEAQYYAAI